MEAIAKPVVPCAAIAAEAYPYVVETVRDADQFVRDNAMEVM